MFLILYTDFINWQRILQNLVIFARLIRVDRQINKQTLAWQKMAGS